MGERLKVMRIMWAAMLGTTGAFAFVVFMVRRAGSVPASAEAPVMLPAMAVIAAMLAGTSFVAPARMYRQSLARAKLAVREEADPNAIGMYRETAPKRRVIADRDAALRAAAMGYQTSRIFGLAMAEAVGVLGIVVGMLGFPLYAALAFIGAGAVLVALRFPTERSYLGPIEATYDATFD